MAPFKKAWDQTGKGVDWLIRGHFVVQLLIALGIGKIFQWLATRYARVPQTLSVAVWLLVSGLTVWLLLALLRKRTFVQQTTLETVAPPGGIEEAIRGVADFYRTGAGPFLDEIEAHFQRLAAHHRDNAERERFLIRGLAAGTVSYLHDMSWASIFKSQLEALNELNVRGATTAETLRPFYNRAAAANPDVYKNYAFDSWLDFLMSHTLVRKDGNVIQITVRGKDFLKYLVQLGRSASDRRY